MFFYFTMNDVLIRHLEQEIKAKVNENTLFLRSGRKFHIKTMVITLQPFGDELPKTVRFVGNVEIEEEIESGLLSQHYQFEGYAHVSDFHVAELSGAPFLLIKK